MAQVTFNRELGANPAVQLASLALLSTALRMAVTSQLTQQLKTLLKDRRRELISTESLPAPLEQELSLFKPVLKM